MVLIGSVVLAGVVMPASAEAAAPSVKVCNIVLLPHDLTERAPEVQRAGGVAVGVRIGRAVAVVRLRERQQLGHHRASETLPAVFGTHVHAPQLRGLARWMAFRRAPLFRVQRGGRTLVLNWPSTLPAGAKFTTR